METRFSPQIRDVLVPTDFSANCRNVTLYAAGLCKDIGARMILFHVYHPPAMISEIPEIHPLEDIEDICLTNMQKIVDELHAQYGPGLLIDQKCQCGFAVDEIKYFEENHPVDLIVMGMREAGYLSERLMGSVTTSLIYQTNRPVLAIGEKVRYKPLQKIVLACDLTGQGDYSALGPLKRLAQLFGAHIHVLNVVADPGKESANQESAARIALGEALGGTEHSFHYAANKDIVSGISEFIHSMDIDLTVMIPRSHSFFENLFHEPSTKRMAFHTDVPLLALHED